MKIHIFVLLLLAGLGIAMVSEKIGAATNLPWLCGWLGALAFGTLNNVILTEIKHYGI